MANGGPANDPGRTPAAPTPPAQVQSVDRALRILEYLAEHGQAGVTDLAKCLDVHKSTAFRLVVALENRQMVEQVQERGKYRLGFGLIRLAGATSVQLDLSKIGRPVVERLAAELGETVNIAVLDSGAAVNVAQEHGGSVVSMRNWIGGRTPLHATSSGKVLLAHDTTDTLSDLFTAPLTRYTECTLSDPAALREELDRVRERGWADCVEELEIGLNSVAAPIFGADGRVTAAVSVAGPSYRLESDRLDDVAKRLVLGAEEISGRLGFFPPRPSQP